MQDIEELIKRIDDQLQALELEEERSKATEETQVSDDVLMPQKRRRNNRQYEEKQLLMLLDFPQAKGRTTINSLQGNFDITEGEMSFKAQTRRGQAVQLPCTFYIKRLLPLLEVFQEKVYGIVLDGNTQNDSFYVYEIHSASATGPKVSGQQPELTDNQIQALLDRLLDPQADIALTDRPVFSTQEELHVLFRVCKYDYPRSIRNWAEHAFSSLTMQGVLGSTDKRHILKSLSYILNIDWGSRPLRVPTAAEVRTRLDRRFYGLETVKQRIMEIAAQLRSTQSLPKWGILLNGPAGVGKTSVANAISDILGMPKAYLEFSVLRDSEALTGSSRIYDNGKPGLVIEQLYANRTANLVMVLNEIDKATESKHGSNPLDMLLPLLDGMGFTDTYIETTIPTDGIFFIATSNEADKISKPILDRFYRIDIPAYSQRDKAVIFDRYILPQALEKACLAMGEVALSEEARDCLLEDYALEPGVRDLEQLAERLVSHYLLEKEEHGLNGVILSKEALQKLLGPPKAIGRSITMRPGMAIGAYCRDGRAHTFAFQAAVRPGNGELELVNVEGERQREYCRLAYECVNLLTENRLGAVDVVLAATVPLQDAAPGNYVGCAASVAILSALQGREYTADELFLGGCDLYGSLYLDERTIDPYLEQLSGQFKTIYSAVGAAELIYEPHPQACLSIVETPNISVLGQVTRIN